MRIFLVWGCLAIGALAGCGGDDNDDPGGSGGTGGGNPGSGGAGTGGAGTGAASAGGAGTGGASSGSGGSSTGPNAYPSDDDVVACWGSCPKGECDDSGFFADVSCDAAYPAPVGASSSYCGSGNGAYCLETDAGDMFGVQCTSGTAKLTYCDTECGGDGRTLECE